MASLQGASLRQLLQASSLKIGKQPTKNAKVVLTVGPEEWLGLARADAASCRQSDVFICTATQGTSASSAWSKAASALGAPVTFASGRPAHVRRALQDLTAHFNGGGVFEHLEFEVAAAALGCGSGKAGCHILSTAIEKDEEMPAACQQLLHSVGSVDVFTQGAALCIVAARREVLRLEQVRSISSELSRVRSRALCELVMVPVWDELAQSTHISLIYSGGMAPDASWASS